MGFPRYDGGMTRDMVPQRPRGIAETSEIFTKSKTTAAPSALPQGGGALRRPLGFCCLRFGKEFLCFGMISGAHSWISPPLFFWAGRFFCSGISPSGRGRGRRRGSSDDDDDDDDEDGDHHDDSSGSDGWLFLTNSELQLASVSYQLAFFVFRLTFT